MNNTSTLDYLKELCHKNNTTEIIKFLEKDIVDPDLDCLKITCKNCNSKVFYKILSFGVKPDIDCLYELCYGLNKNNVKTISVVNCIKKILKYDVIPDDKCIRIILNNDDIIEDSTNVLVTLLQNEIDLDVECTKLLMKSQLLLLNLLHYIEIVDFDCFKILASKQYPSKYEIISKFCRLGLDLNYESLKIACSYRDNDQLIKFILEKNIKPTDECLELSCKTPGNHNSIILMIEMGIDFGYDDFKNQCNYDNKKVISIFLDNDIVPDIECLELLTKHQNHKENIIRIIDEFKVTPNLTCFRNIVVWLNDNTDIVYKLIKYLELDYTCLPYNNDELFKLVLSKIKRKQTLFEDIFNNLPPEIGIILFDKLVMNSYKPTLDLIETILLNCKNRRYVDIIMNIDMEFSQKCLERICNYTENEIYIVNMIKNGIKPNVNCLLNATNLDNNDYIIIQFMDVKIDDKIKYYFSHKNHEFLISETLTNKIKPTYQCLLNACSHTNNELSVLYMIQTNIKPTVKCLKLMEQNGYHDKTIRETIKRLDEKN